MPYDFLDIVHEIVLVDLQNLVPYPKMVGDFASVFGLIEIFGVLKSNRKSGS